MKVYILAPFTTTDKNRYDTRIFANYADALDRAMWKMQDCENVQVDERRTMTFVYQSGNLEDGFEIYPKEVR